MSARDGIWHRLAQQLATSIEALRTWPWYDTLRTLQQRFREDRLGQTAGSLTFTTVLALVPLFTVALALFAAFPMFARLQVALQQYFLQTLVPDSIAKPVLSALTVFSGKAKGLGATGLGFLVASALALMLTIERTLNGIWRVRKPRPLAQRVLINWAALTLGPVLLGFSLSLSTHAISASSGFAEQLPGGIAMVLGLVQFVALAVAMAGLYFYVPNTHVHWRHALAGGVFVALGFDLARRGLAWYVGAVPAISLIYGAFVTLPLLLLWVYLSWVIVLLGAVIAAYAPSLRMRVVRHGDDAGQGFALAVSLLRLLDQARHTPRRGLSTAEFAAMLRADPLQIDPNLELLMHLGWVGRIDEADPQRHVLLCDPQRTPAAPLLDRLLLTPAAATQPFRQAARLDAMNLAQLLGD